ncbi:MAG: FAD-dependent oxidoreductase [Anaerolineae bacterium]|nr:FAD-dependent oxidoreductase [Anaerolineae bacterium]
MSNQNVLVIGCGVSGLSCGIRLLQRGWRVRLVARELPPQTTSNVAAAIWYPYRAYPEERVLAWSAASFQEFLRLTAVPAAGISLTTLMEPYQWPVADPWWLSAVPHFRRAAAAELPPGYVDGYVAEVPLIETPIYMQYLMQQFQALGGVIEQREVADLTAVSDQYPLIINCAGLGARKLVDDATLYPIRGQIMRVTAVTGLRAWIDEHSDRGQTRGQTRGLTYIIPRQDGVILGGTAQEGDWNLAVDGETAVHIRQNCLQLEPRLQDAEILEQRVGLRPGRPEVRLEAETLTSTCTVIHNYGHGGAGFTLSWGCAAEVVMLAEAVAGNW